jgi:chloramphenicol 3-O-phosphotransferase
MKPITILTGPAASGKNTIAGIYAMQFSERCAIIDVDAVRQMLRHPHLAPWDGEAGVEQHRLGVRNACLLAKSFVGEEAEVVILDVLWNDLPQIYRRELNGLYLQIVRLMPSWDEALRRLHGRAASISDNEARWVYDTQEALTAYDVSLDNGAMTADEVAAWLAQRRR